jgi:hypothetical protein
MNSFQQGLVNATNGNKYVHVVNGKDRLIGVHGIKSVHLNRGIMIPFDPLNPASVELFDTLKKIDKINEEVLMLKNINYFI